MWSRIEASAALRRHVLVTALALMAVIMGTAGCEGTSHDNIDRWMSTEKGPSKLKSALDDGDIDADLRAHAAQNLVRMDELEHVIEAMEAMPQAERDAVLGKLVPRLWDDARVDGELTMPSPIQSTAKDALFDVRRLASPEIQRAIDSHLVDWLTGGYFAARARSGRVRGEAIMRVVGPEAAPALLRSAKSLLVTPAGTQRVQYKLEDPLLIGLAATGSPDAVAFLLDLLAMEHNDKELPARALDALHVGYVDPGGEFERQSPRGLEPHLGRLVALAQDETRGNRAVNDAVRLIGAVGPPACIQPLVELIAFPHQAENYLWVAANAALQCGKAQALVPVADAMPRTRDYALSDLEGAILEPMAVLDDRQAVAQTARTLLGSESWIARVIGVELLGRVATPQTAAADAEAVRKLVGDATPLRGWWGDQSQVPKAERKPTPRLGERAEEVAKRLDQMSKSG